MDRVTLETTIKVHLKDQCREGCGDRAREQMIYEVNTFLNAASLINRINKT